MREVVVTHVRDSVQPRGSRNLEERLMVRFPFLYQRPAALMWRLLSPGSRLRRVILRRQVVSGWTAGNRRDMELVLVRYAADVELEFDPGFQTLGLGDRVTGHEAFVEAYRGVWDAFEAEIEPSDVVDLGDRVLVLGLLRTRARSSGLELKREMAELSTLREGVISHDRLFLGWDVGLRAADIDPGAINLPSGATADRPAST
jgi:SnoaL-like domain